MTSFIGVDQSLTATGFVLYIEPKSLIFSHCFRAEGSSQDPISLYRRIAQVRDQLTCLIDTAELCGGIEAVFIEEAMKSSRGRVKGNNETTRTLAKLESSLVINCLDMGVRPVLLSAGVAKTSWNRRLGAKKPKEEWRAKIEEWNPQWLVSSGVTADEIDALGVLWGGVCSLGLKRPEELTKNELIRIKFTRGKTDITREITRTLRELDAKDQLLKAGGIPGVQEEVLA